MLHKTRLHKHNTITRLELASAATAPEEKGRVVDGQVQDGAVARDCVDDVVLVGVVEEHDLPLDPGSRPRRARDRQREPVDVGRVDDHAEVQRPAAVRRARVRPDGGARLEPRDPRGLEAARPPHGRHLRKSTFYGAFVLSGRVDLHAIDAMPAR